MAAQPPDEDVEVRLEDQKAINTFGRLNTRMNELQDELKERRAAYDELDDAANEIILADDDEPIRYGFGECYFETSKEQAEELLEKRKEQVEADISGMADELASIQATLAQLKTQLYARFGNNINLEA